jgi:hypothetical protein
MLQATQLICQSSLDSSTSMQHGWPENYNVQYFDLLPVGDLPLDALNMLHFPVAKSKLR